MASDVEIAGADKALAAAVNMVYTSLIAVLGPAGFGVANDKKAWIFLDKDGNPLKGLTDATGTNKIPDKAVVYANSDGHATGSANLTYDEANSILKLLNPFTLGFGDQTQNGAIRIRIDAGLYFERRVNDAWSTVFEWTANGWTSYIQAGSSITARGDNGFQNYLECPAESTIQIGEAGGLNSIRMGQNRVSISATGEEGEVSVSATSFNYNLKKVVTSGDFVEITGTTDESGYVTFSYPNGFTKENTKVLCIKSNALGTYQIVSVSALNLYETSIDFTDPTLASREIKITLMML